MLKIVLISVGALLILLLMLFALWVYVIIIWPTRKGRYKNATYGKGVRIAAVGDSITQGGLPWEINQYSYPAVLQKQLGKKFTVGNFGVNGATATNGLVSSYTKTAAYKESIKFNPEVVLIMLGTNDSKVGDWDEKKYRQDYRSLIKTYKDIASVRKVYVMLSIPAYKTPFKIQPDVIAKSIPGIVEDISTELNVEIIDLASKFDEKFDLYTKDLVHPTRKGYKYMGEKVFEFLYEKNLKRMSKTKADSRKKRLILF